MNLTQAFQTIVGVARLARLTDDENAAMKQALQVLAKHIEAQGQMAPPPVPAAS